MFSILREYVLAGGGLPDLVESWGGDPCSNSKIITLVDSPHIP